MKQNEYPLLEFLHKWKKAILLLVSILLLLCITAAETWAYLFDVSDPVINTFQAAVISNDVNESFNGEEKRDVRIQNTGNTPSYIRVAVVVTWKKKISEDSWSVYGTAPVLGTDYTMDIASDSYSSGSVNNSAILGEWQKAADGFYYFTEPVEAGASTDILIKEIKMVNGGTPPEGYYLNVEILSSGIQSMPHDAVTEAWSSGISGFKKESEKETDTLIIKGSSGG